MFLHIASISNIVWLVASSIIKGVISKFWNFLYYWSDLTEIFTQYVKLNKKHFLFLNIFPFRA